MEPIEINKYNAGANSEFESVSFLLSICIPTYNRCQALDIAIRNIISQPGFDHRTEIVILDNNSTDDTKGVADNYTAAYSNIVYYRNAENIGIEKNIIQALKCGRGKLIKLWNDYCLFADNKLEVMLGLIKENADESSIIYFHNKPGKGSALTCYDLDTFFRKTSYWPTWIGTFSIWNADLKSFENTSQFEGLLFPHLLMLLKAFENKKKIRIIYGVNFLGGKGIKKGGYDFYEIFVKNFIGNIIHKIYSEKKINLVTLYIVKASFLNKFLSKWMADIVFSKSHNFNNKNVFLVFKYFRFYPQFYLLLIKLPFYPILKGGARSFKKLYTRLNIL